MSAQPSPKPLRASPRGAAAPIAGALDEVLNAARAAPFYASHLVGARAERWGQVPYLTKDDLRRAYPFGLLAVARAQVASYHESTGTSGEPTSSYFTESDWDDVASRFARNAVAMTPADTVLVKTPYSMVTTAHQMHRAARLCGSMVIPADNRSANMGYPRVLRLLADVPVSVAWCLPTEGLLWAAAARAAGRDSRHDFPALRAFVVAGEPASPEKRRRIGELWGARVFEDYGSTETGSLAGECTAGRLHLWADRFHFEVRDPATGDVRREGRGELVVTSLYRQAMPLVRYRLGDSVDISYEPCSCGWAWPTLRVSGRSSVGFSVADKHLFPVDLEAAVFSLPIERGVLFWRARCLEQTIEVEVETAPGQEESAQDELESTILARTSIRASVRARPLIPVEALTSTVAFRKPRFVFDRGEDWSSAVLY